MKTKEKSTLNITKGEWKEAEIFYCNYEFEDAPVNGVEQMDEDQLIELMLAFSKEQNSELLEQRNMLLEAATTGSESLKELSKNMSKMGIPTGGINEVIRIISQAIKDTEQ